ncbi:MULTISPECIES: capsule biosynthesis protein [Cupriavidus]
MHLLLRDRRNTIGRQADPGIARRERAGKGSTSSLASSTASGGASVEQASIGQLAGYRRILLLQGPNGPFFAGLRDQLEQYGSCVWKINFNGGDDLFYHTGNILRFRDKMGGWEDFLLAFLARERIEAIVVFGDCRRPHRIAARVARKKGIAFWVFEEGYVRPDYITLEAGGVNADSPLGSLSLDQIPDIAKPPRHLAFHHTFRKMAWYSFLYFAAGLAGACRYPQYRHHKPFGLRELSCWLRAGYRRPLYLHREKGTIKRLLSHDHPPFFLVALQVHNDSQIRMHSPWRRVEDFIEWTMFSFSRYAPAGSMLVIKHHPMDRGHTDYTRMISACARRLGVASRVAYVHDAHLPSLLQRCKGLVTVNSTVGLQALFHSVPVIVLGRSFYAKEGVTFLGSLDEFWSSGVPLDKAASTRLRNYVIRASQINASFYAKAGSADIGYAAHRLKTLGMRLACIASLVILDVLDGTPFDISGKLRWTLAIFGVG